jgi:type I restriction enzyme S subunit
MQSNKRTLQELLIEDFDGVWGDDAVVSSGVPVIRSTDMREGKLSYDKVAIRSIPPNALRIKRLIPGDILVNKSSGSAHLVGKSVIFFPPDNNDYYCSNFIRCLRPNKSIVDCEFLYYGLQSPHFQSQIFGAQRTTSGLRNLKISEFKSGTIGVPNSLDEQRRIVARIKECMERVEEIKENSQAIKNQIGALLPSILHARFEYLRGSVDIEKLENIAEIEGGASLPKGGSEDLGNDCVLLVKVGDMNEPGNDRIISISRAFLPTSKTLKKVILPGAVIFPKRGGAIATNKKRMLGRPAIIDPNLMAVIAKPERVRNEYLYYWTQSLDLRDISNGGVIPQLNRKDLAPLEVPVPTLEKQEIIINELEQAEVSCSELRVTFEEADQECISLRDAILHKAFAGEL